MSFALLAISLVVRAQGIGFCEVAAIRSLGIAERPCSQRYIDVSEVIVLLARLPS